MEEMLIYQDIGVGGKTGTAQKYGEDGKIVQGKHIASFIGFAPQMIHRSSYSLQSMSLK